MLEWLIFDLFCVDLNFRICYLCLLMLTAPLRSTIETWKVYYKPTIQEHLWQPKNLTMFTIYNKPLFPLKDIFIIATMLGAFTFPLILFTVIVLVLNSTESIPYHGSQIFFGYDYWTRRYPSLDYSDWNGFWNNHYSGRTQYKRASSETAVQECTGCQCDDFKQELRCFGSPGKL